MEENSYFCLCSYRTISRGSQTALEEHKKSFPCVTEALRVVLRCVSTVSFNTAGAKSFDFDVIGSCMQLQPAVFLIGNVFTRKRGVQ